MSRRTNRTNRAASALWLSMYRPMNTGKRKRPKGESDLVLGHTKTHKFSLAENGGKINGGN